MVELVVSPLVCPRVIGMFANVIHVSVVVELALDIVGFRYYALSFYTLI